MGATIGSMINNTVMGIIIGVVFITVGVALGPTVTSAALEINATTLAGVELAGVIVFLATLVPAFYYLGIVVGGIAMIWKATQSKG
jgi:hypothetical protein